MKKILAAIYIVLIPVFSAPNLPILGKKVAYCDIIFLLLFFILAKEIIFRRQDWKIREWLIFSIIPIGISFSLLNTIDLPRSIIEFAGIFYLSILAWVVVKTVDSERSFFFLIKVWVIAGFVYSVLGIAGYITAFILDKPNALVMFHPSLTSSMSFMRYRSVVFCPTAAMFGSYLHITIILNFILLIKYNIQKKWRFWIWISICLSSICAVLTMARTISGTILSIFVIFAGVSIFRKRLWPICKYASFLFFIVYFILTIMTTIWWIFPAKFSIDKLSTQVDISFNVSPSLYHILNKTAVDIAYKNPIVGVGPGNFNKSYMEYVKEPQYYNFPYPASIKDKYDPHSTYLGWLAETGIIGLTAILLFFILLIMKFSAVLPFHQRDFTVCFLAGIYGFLLNGIHVDIITMRHLWFFCALGVVLMKIYKDRSRVFIGDNIADNERRKEYEKRESF